MQAEETGLLNQPMQRKDFASQPRDPSWYLLTFLAIALLLRVVLFHFFPGIYWADEIFQTQEPAHRLAYGPGMITWEYRLGMCCWVLPGIISGLMKCTAWLGPRSSGYVFGIALFFSLLY